MTTDTFIFGIHAVYALLEKAPKRIVRLCIQHERQDKKINALLSLAKTHHVPFEFLSRSELDRLTHASNHQGVLAYCVKTTVYAESDLPALLQQLSSPPFVLVLDSVQDPHNLGASFRSADAAGVQLIIAPKDRAAGITPIVSKVASGATETVTFVQVTNLVRALQILKDHGLWVYGAAAEANQSLYQTDLSVPLALVMGAEGTGLRRLTREHCDGLLHIPMHGTVSSLNISVAAGIFLFEAVRQRGG